MADKNDRENQSSSSDDDESTTTTSSSSTSSSDDDDTNEQADEESDDNLTSLSPKQAYLYLENKRKNLGKRLLELRDELKAQPQADIDTKKRLLTEIKNLREKWIAVQTRLTNLKARLSHSPTPERKITKKTPTKKPEEPVQTEARVIPPPRLRTSYSSSSRSRSSSTASKNSDEKPYHDLDALDNDDNANVRDAFSSRQATSYRDLMDDRSLSSSSPSSPSNIISLSNVSLHESKSLDEDAQEQNETAKPKETFYNQAIPYPIVNDKRDLEVISRQIKNQLRELEASKSNPIYDSQSNLMSYERLKKQNEYINLRIKIEKLKKYKPKTQREKEQNKKQFHQCLQEFRKLQRFMRAANRNNSNNQFFTMNTDIFPSLIPLPPSPELKQQPVSSSLSPPPQPMPRQEQQETILPPLDLHKVTGKKILFESSDSDDDDDETEPIAEPQVPVSLSISEPRTVPEGLEQVQSLSLPMPSSSSSSATLNAIKTRVANLIHAPIVSSAQTNMPATSSQTTVNDDDNDDDDDDDDTNQSQPVVNLEKSQAKSAKFNRKRRKTKRHRHKKKHTNTQITQQATNENELTAIDQEEAWKRHVAMQLQFSFLKRSNPILRALTTEAYRKLGVNPDDISDFQLDEDMDYATAVILQQQKEFLEAAAANPFNVLRNAAVVSSSSRPNLVDVLSNLNGGVASSSSSEPQTPMSLLHRIFLDPNNNSNAGNRKNPNDLSTTPPTPPTLLDISHGRRIVESLTHQDINALLKLSGSEHDDDDDDDDNNNASIDGDTDDDDINNISFDEDSNDMPNGDYNNKTYERWERPTPIPSRGTQSLNINNKKSSLETLILPSFNRCTHLGKSTKRSAGVERMFPSFSKHNAGPSSTLSLILYGLSSTP